MESRSEQFEMSFVRRFEGKIALQSFNHRGQGGGFQISSLELLRSAFSSDVGVFAGGLKVSFTKIKRAQAVTASFGGKLSRCLRRILC